MCLSLAYTQYPIMSNTMTGDVFQWLTKKGTYWWVGKNKNKDIDIQYPFEQI